MLGLAGVTIKNEKQITTDCCGIEFKFGPKILIEPSFALTLQDLRDRFECKVEIEEDAALVMSKSDDFTMNNTRISGIYTRGSNTFGTAQL